MSIELVKEVQVYSLEELPKTNDKLRYIACIGGKKNYQCFLEKKTLSRTEFMIKYKERLDICHRPIYEDNDIIIRQDAMIPMPGFYIVATKRTYKKLSFMDLKTYQKCLEYVVFIKKKLSSKYGIDRFYIYYEEHYKKPSSTHFWVMPIYEKILLENNLNPTIINYDIWKYQELFEFQHTREIIYNINDYMQKVLKKEKEV